MRSRLLRPDDIKGAWAIVPTPATENASDWRSENTVDWMKPRGGERADRRWN